MKMADFLALLAALVLLMPAAFAKDKTEHNVTLSQPVQVGSARLQPGKYKVEWQGVGKQVPITFVQNGKTVLSTTGQVIEKDKAPQSDEVMMRKTRSNQQRLEELDFGNKKEALLFAPHAKGM